jgi:hypothetical protein
MKRKQADEKYRENPSVSDALPAGMLCEFCMGKSSKTLALCAARSHIVAVR